MSATGSRQTPQAAVSATERALLERLPTDLFVGEWRAPGEEKRFPVCDPATGEQLLEVADGAASDALDALDAAVAAQAAWSATPPRSRADVLLAAYEAVMRNIEEFALVITLEMGKPLAEARGEVSYAADYLRWYAEEAVRADGHISRSPDGRSIITTAREPVGPCLLITPWNFPLAMPLRKLAPALAAGCTTVLKPAELTPLSSLLMAKTFSDVGLPPGVCNVITTTDPSSVAGTLLADSRLRKLSFTGSTAVGRWLLGQSAPQLLRTSLELGGNAPLIVFDDCDLDRAVDGALLAKLRNGGQSCIAANRILVQDRIADTFTERFVGRLRAAVLGRGTAPDTTLGPLIDERAVAKATRLVDEAIERGARLLCGGSAVPGSGAFFAATALEIEGDAEILHEEIFAPVAPIVRFRSESEAIERANDTPYGLAAYVFTEDLDRAERVSAGVSTGMVGLNQGIVSNVAAPFGGIKQSGIGREGGHAGLEEYLSIKYVARASPRAATG